MDLLQSLQQWFAAHCDGDWENYYGLHIESCDNPGWWVKVDLTGTELHSRPFPEIAENVDAQRFQQGERWLNCYVENGVWHGAGDETKLATILETFLSWAAEP